MRHSRQEENSIKVTGGGKKRKMIWSKKKEDYGVIRKIIRVEGTSEEISDERLQMRNSESDHKP